MLLRPDIVHVGRQALEEINISKERDTLFKYVLEISIIETASFGTVFPKIILNFRKCRNAPCRSRYITMVRGQTFRKHLHKVRQTAVEYRQC
jgi:hypothetical protein